MKKILIIGKNSYIAKNLVSWLTDSFEINIISVRDDKWKQLDFSIYSAVIYVAGIVHRKDKNIPESLYYLVNSEVPYNVGIKAKKENVPHFIYFSTMSVFGINEGIINKDTKVNPTTIYGKSKLLGENKLLSLNSKTFNLSIIRPPMVYGKSCTGNYSRLSKLIKKIRVFPYVDNLRGIIYIENLCESIRLIIEKNIYGIIHPQDDFLPSTVNIVSQISKVNNFKILTIPMIGKILKRTKLNVFKKLLGSLYYEKKFTDIGYNYNIVTFYEAIRRTEK